MSKVNKLIIEFVNNNFKDEMSNSTQLDNYKKLLIFLSEIKCSISVEDANILLSLSPKLNRMISLQIVTPTHIELAASSSLESLVTLKKDVEGCIEKNQQFFNEILDVERIYVYGFSFSSIDMPYLEKIIRRTKPETHWVISWYSQDDKRRIIDFVIRYDIQNFTMINGIKHLDIQV